MPVALTIVKKMKQRKPAIPCVTYCSTAAPEDIGQVLAPAHSQAALV